MKGIQKTGLVMSAVMSMSIMDLNYEPINLKTTKQIFNRFKEGPLSVIDYPKIAYEKSFYKDYIREELKESNYLRNECLEITFHEMLDSLSNEAMKFNRSNNNNPRKSGKVYLKDINNNGYVGVGKKSGYYFERF